MGRRGTPCSICDHPQRAAIDLALANRVPQRELAAQFGVGQTVLSRHKTRHLGLTAAPPPTPSERRRAQRLGAVSDEDVHKALTRGWLVKSHLAVLDELRALCDDVKAGGNQRLLLDALGGVSKQLGELGKAAGLVGPAVAVQVNNLPPATAGRELLRGLDLDGAPPEVRRWLSGQLIDSDAETEGQP